MLTLDPRRSPDADRLLASYDDATANTARALRSVVMGVDPRIREGVKWGAPSYHIGEHFATLHVLPHYPLVVVLHRGAHGRPAQERLPIPDPLGMLDWRTNDRANVKLLDAEHVENRRAELQAIVKGWLDAM